MPANEKSLEEGLADIGVLGAIEKDFGPRRSESRELVDGAAPGGT